MSLPANHLKPAASQGLLISFDGVDSSGKETQAKSLADRLRYHGHVVRQFQTPDYTTPSGKELKLRLQHKLGDWDKTSWQDKLGYFAANRAEHHDEVVLALKRGEIVIYDRYVPSSLAFITIEASTAQAVETVRDEVQAAVKEQEYTKNEMPLENVSIFLDVPPRIAGALLEQRKEKLTDEDEYTDHIEVQRRLYNEYDVIIKDNPKQYLRISCVMGGQLLGVSDISELVWEGIISRLPQIVSPKKAKKASSLTKKEAPNA